MPVKSIHGYIEYVFLLALAMISILVGIVVYDELHVISGRERRKTRRKPWIVASFIIGWGAIFVCYFLSIRHTYRDLAIDIDTNESHRHKSILIITFSVSVLLNMIIVLIFFKSKAKWLRYVSLLLIASIFAMVMYQAWFIGSYDVDIMWWLKSPYAIELVFSFMLNICLLVNWNKIDRSKALG